MAKFSYHSNFHGLVLSYDAHGPELNPNPNTPQTDSSSKMLLRLIVALVVLIHIYLLLQSLLFTVLQEQ